MRVAEREQAHVVAGVARSHARRRPAAVPFHGNVAGQDEVEDAAAQADEDGIIGGGAPHFARAVADLETDAPLAEVPDRFGPDARPEAMNQLWRALRPGIHDSMNGYQQPRWRVGGAGRGR